MTFLMGGLAILLALLAGALRAAGASMIRTPRADALHDAAEGDQRAQIVADLLEDRPKLQPAITTIHSALLVGAAVSAGWTLASLVPGWRLLFALVLLGVVVVILGDLLPRRWGRSRPRSIAYRFASFLRLAARLGRRAVDLVEEEDGEEEIEEETEDQEQDRAERELISSVLEFSDAVVREVMVPRTDMVTVHQDATTDQALELAIARGYSRIPVLGDGPDHVLGIIYAKDLLQVLDLNQTAKPVIEIMRPAYFVPETKRVAGLLREMQANKVHMAMVVDEFGGIAGLVTIEDVLEELVGEIIDEYDSEEPMVVPQRNGDLLVDGRVPVDELGELLGVDLPDGDWDTVGGLVLGLAGRVPREGESFEVDDALLVPERVQGRRVARVRVSRR